ncbi:hypothetical protein A7U60_g8353 [Sanghuangporus baumii]|uniref:Uncharacterized protein n=1 Tax=Sanghuangporus baumii TaxID=108892 RepID=A0A9Q5HR20_SANBA|nr:hypothetical protein A7U60_g8353 [Sanghuangporus baumii]
MFTPNIILMGHESGKVTLFDVKMGEEVLKHTWTLSSTCSSRPTARTSSPAAKTRPLVYMIRGKFETRFWHKIFEEEVRRVKGHLRPINILAMHPSGKCYASGGEGELGENALQKRQLDDLGLQIKGLFKELGRLQDATLPSDEVLQVIRPALNVEEVITINLVLHKLIPELTVRFNPGGFGKNEKSRAGIQGANGEGAERGCDDSGLYQREGHAKDYDYSLRTGRDTSSYYYSQAGSSSPQVNGSGVDAVKLREEVLHTSVNPASTSEKLKIFRNGTNNSSANTQIERLRNECSNLHAEKKTWEDVQTRLIDENKVLSLERSRMADLIANVQKMHNDIDKANGNGRRRFGNFETRIHDLESQAIDRNDVQALKDEIEDLQIDLLKDLSDEKERLASQAAAATSSDSNAEVESLKTQLAPAVQEKETSAKLLADETSKVAKAAADHEAALNPGADAAEIATRHAKELRVLEVRFAARHEEELKAAIERTRKEAKEEDAKASAATSLGTTQDMISKEEHEQALKAATERSTMESATKLKWKDGMLQKALANVKHFEAQIKG